MECPYRDDIKDCDRDTCEGCYIYEEFLDDLVDLY